MNFKIIAIKTYFLRNIKQFSRKKQNTIIKTMVNKNNCSKMHPENLCKKCGKCCRVVTNNDYTYSELQKMAMEGNPSAKDFIKLFEPYSSIDEARKIDSTTVDNIITHLKMNGKYDEKTLTFYKCRYILKNNLCSIYEERPAMCIYNHNNAWIVTPPSCGFNAWLFLKRENDMQRVRRAKEELLDLKVMKTKTKDLSIICKIESIEKKINSTIELYAKYGSNDW